MPTILARILLEKGPYKTDYIKNAIELAAKKRGRKGYSCKRYGFDSIAPIELTVETYDFVDGQFFTQRAQLYPNVYTVELRQPGNRQLLSVDIIPIVTKNGECAEIYIALSCDKDPIRIDHSDQFAAFWKEFLNQLPPF
jgi:hypothetical protein